MDDRYNALLNWLSEHVTPITNISPLAGDASFRRYYRVVNGCTTFIAMDSPPHLENPIPFISIGSTFAKLGLNVPTIHAADQTKGFLLISDLGEQLYLNALNPASADMLYKLALNELNIIQACTTIPGWQLPLFDAEFMLTEMRLCQQWFLERHLELTIDSTLQQLLDNTFNLLIQSALNQPQCCVHRDYHSRNLMLLPQNRIGVLDFQDAAWGPITYDAISLLRDCYIAWPIEQVKTWAFYFYQLRYDVGILKHHSPEEFMRWFDYMGLQRHLKCLFIFARKYHRDGTEDYLADLPRTLNYVTSISALYPELAHFHDWFANSVTPRLEKIMVKKS